MDYGHTLEFGVFLTPRAIDASAVVESAVIVERAGLDLVAFQDHPYQPAFLDTWTLLSFVAARTDRVGLVPDVLTLPLRPPAVLARAAASLDRLSGGRVRLGLGAGAFWEGIVAMGGAPLRPGEAVSALEEAIGIIRALWDVSAPGGASVDGRFHRVHDARRGPAPAHPVPIWLGAYKPRMLALTGALADGWLPSLGYLPAGGLAAGNAAIDAAAVAAGRDPAAIRRVLNIPPSRADSVGWAGMLARLATEQGVSGFVLATDDAAQIGRFAVEVVPAVRDAVGSARGAA